MRTDNIYITRIKKLSPVRIDYVPLCHSVGRYYYSAMPRHIEINSNCSESQQATALLHEIGHALCDIKGCKCHPGESIDHITSEYHAYKFTLQWVKRNNKLRLQFINDIKYALSYSPVYKAAAERIMKLKSWTRINDDFT